MTIATRNARHFFSARALLWAASAVTLLPAGIAPSAMAQQPATPAARPAPAPLLVPDPHYISLPMSIDVNAPVDKVWARVGGYCAIGEWLNPGPTNTCKILSGTDGEFGAVRSVGNEVLVGKTKYSYTYTQPVRVGVPFNMYHGTLEAVPLTATTSRLYYTLFYDNSMLADDAARAADLISRRARFTQALANMKILAEGGTLPPTPTRPAAR